MSAEIIYPLIEVTLAMSAGILIVGGLRKPTRLLAGAQAAYWLWLLIPTCVLAIAVPAPESSPAFIMSYFPQAIEVPSKLGTAVADSSIDYGFWILAVWLTGSTVMLFLAVKRHRLFQNVIGRLAADVNGRLQGNNVAGPMLVGVWRPRIALPMDFNDRYSDQERAMILAHEEAHCARHDALVNAVATTALCLFWTNPLMHWAVNRFRFDQELACDACVLAQFQGGNRRYANALLKAQLANEAHSRLPVACHWQSVHPLKERITMLKRPLPGAMRRMVGGAAVIAVIGLSSYSVWATQPVGLKETPASDQSSGFRFSSQKFFQVEDGVYVATGNVEFTPPPGSPPAKVSSDLADSADDSSVLLEGNVTIQIGEIIVNTDRATIVTDGTIRMDAAWLSNFPALAAPNDPR